MIDLEIVRKNPEETSKLIKKKDPHFDAERLVELDILVRQMRLEVESLRHKKNEMAKQGQHHVTAQLRQLSLELSEELKQKEHALSLLETQFKELYLYCPNIVLADVPEGTKEANQVVKVFGEKPVFDFDAKNHVELGALNGWFDFEAAARMAGSNFALYKGQGVKAAYSLMFFMLNHNSNQGYMPLLPPYLVNSKALEGAGNFPRFKDEVYAITGEDLYLTPTAEVNLTSIYANHIFMVPDLPVRMTAWTSCFRKEAGSYGAHERGLIRIHQFEKAELYVITEPEHAQQEQDRMLACAESLLQRLGLHYRVSLLAAQDCSFASAKTYDIEVWMPGQGVYKEVSSVSNCTDFQARRSKIRYKIADDARASLVYTLNASSLALPRLMVALMETYQQKEGTICLPDVLKMVY